jgi:hypothetical protein
VGLSNKPMKAWIEGPAIFATNTTIVIFPTPQRVPDGPLAAVAAPLGVADTGGLAKNDTPGGASAVPERASRTTKNKINSTVRRSLQREEAGDP